VKLGSGKAEAAVVDPFSNAIHGFKAILLKDGAFAAIRGDLLLLFALGIGTLPMTTPLFKRTL
jgi:ABC-2 type transport system permease protein